MDKESPNTTPVAHERTTSVDSLHRDRRDTRSRPRRRQVTTTVDSNTDVTHLHTSTSNSLILVVLYYMWLNNVI